MEDGEEGGSVVAESGTGGALQQSPPVTTASHTTHGDQGVTLQVGPSHTVAFFTALVRNTQKSRDHELYDHCRSVDTLLALLGYLFKHINLLSRVRLIACTEILLLSSSTFNQISPASKPLTQ